MPPADSGLTATPAPSDPSRESTSNEGTGPTRDRTRFVLIDTSHPGNVGATARAMKVMGFRDLVLVRPRFADVLSQEETVAMASGAADILARARIVDRLEDALDGCTFVCATAMTPRDFGPPRIDRASSSRNSSRRRMPAAPRIRWRSCSAPSVTA